MLTLIGRSLVHLQERLGRDLRPAKIMLGLVLGILLVVSTPSASLAQATSSATLRGTVKDQSGAVVAKAAVTLISASSGAERKTTTNNEGIYVFSAVNPGVYTVKIEASGFKTLSQAEVVLSPSETRALDATLEIGIASEIVTVTGTSEEIKTETGEKSNTITAAQIENLSIISRNSLELLRVLPGVVAPNMANLQVSGFGDAGAYNVNGQRGQNNNVSVDGSRVIDIGCNCGGIVSLNNDMVQEVTIKTSNYAPEHGNSAVLITGTTKSGGRDFHGSIYSYNRHEALAANDRFRNYTKAEDPTSPAAQKPLGRFYYPGFTLGGPIILPKKVFGPLGGLNQNRDRLFFFVGFEEQRQRFSAQPKIGTVPSLKQRQGDFSEFIGDPEQQFLRQNLVESIRVPGGFPGAGTAIPDNNLSPYINPIGRTLINLYPLPNFNDPNGENNYIATPIQSQNRRDLKMRFDYKVSDQTNIYVRITRELEVYDGPYGIWWGPSSYELPSHNIENRLGRSVAVNLTKVINPTMTNEVVFSGSKLKLDNQYADPSKLTLSSLGLENLVRLPFDNTQFGKQSPYVPLSIINWTLGNHLWSPGTNPIFAYNDSFSVTDNLTKVAGTHTFKFGALIEQGNKKQNFQGDPDSQGQLVIDRGLGNGTGNEFGNLLVGQLNDVSHGTQPPVGNYRFYNYEFYAQDSFKLRPNFTLEYGVRASHMTINKERKGFDILFDPSAYQPGAGYYINGDPFRPNGILSARRGEIEKGAFSPPGVLWGPRLNFAWDVFRNAKLVIRGGAGIFYNRVQGNFQYDATLRAAPNGNVGSTINGNTDIPGTGGVNFNDLGGLTLNNMGIATLSDGRQVPVDPLRLANGGAAIISPNPNSRDFPQTYTMSLSVATRMPFQTVLETSYVGTFGRHLPARMPINFVPRGAILNAGGVPNDPGSGDAENPIHFLADPNCDRGEVAADGRTVIRPGNCVLVEATGVRADLNNPLHRAALAGASINKFRPFSDLNNVRYQEYTATSNYHSLQMTLSRQAGKNLQFFATYTFSKVLGNTSGEFADQDPLDARGRTYGVLNYDRTHIFNLSYNYNLPNLSPVNNAFGRGLFNGWQISGITTFASGTPIRLKFSGDITQDALAVAAFGTNAFQNDQNSVGAIAPIFLRDPRLDGKNVGESVIDLDAIAIPAFGSSGPTISPFYFRSPNTMNWDISLFKNFKIKESKTLQFRAGFFNIFNQAFPTTLSNNNAGSSDIHLTLNAACVRTPVNQTIALANGTVLSPANENAFTQTIPDGNGGRASNVCDPSKGFTFNSDTVNNFGKITTKRGQRIIELALKFTF
jgi:Carboxypeptidase regulatory-like domain/TonB-dependent Receptor Plug Domain